MKLGELLQYFTQPLVVGFTSGIALVVFSTRIKDALGLNIEKVPSEFIDKWETYFSQMGIINIYAGGITLITYIDIQNIYNRKNINGYRWDYNNNEMIEQSEFGILPSIGLSIEL